MNQLGKRDQGWPGMLAVILAVVLMMGLFLTGCGQDPNNASPGTSQNGKTPDKSAQPTQKSVILYFGDKEAMYLVPETRVVDIGDENLETAIVNELIKGPQKAGSGPTIPEGTRLLSVSVANGVANVNLSKEFQTRHGGGSAGETMTIYSVVNTLTRLPGVEKVQFLLEGDKLESILGHMDTTVPITPDTSLIPK